MAVFQEDILARIQQIYTAQGNTPQANAQIAREAQQFGVTPEQIGTATGLLGTQVRTLAEESGQAFAPMQMTGGMLGGTNINLTQPSTSPVSTAPPAQPVTVGMPEQTFERYTPTITSGMLSNIETGDQFAFSDLLYNLNTSDRDLTQLRPAIENIAKSATGNQGTDPAYNFLVQSAAEAKLKEDYNEAVDRGDTNKAEEIRTAVLGGPTTSYSYYLTQYPEGSAHKIVQDTFNDPFNIGAPGKYQTSFFEKIGDAVSDTIQNPYVQAVTAFIPGVGPAISSVMQAWGTLDSGENLSPTQIVAALAGASKLSGLEGGNLIKMLPKELQETATAFQKAVEGGWDEAITALKNSGLDATSEQFAAFEDGIRAVVGDENIEAISGTFAGIEDGVRDLFEGQFGGVDNRLGSIEETLALLEQASLNRGGGFTPQRGVQGPVARPRLTKYEDSDVLAVMNLPSSVQQRP